MSRWSARRAQTEPLAALSAVLVLGLALALYADALDAAAPIPADPGVADAALQRVHEAVTDGAVARPDRIDDGLTAVPHGYEANVTIDAGGHRWSAGPTPPEDASAARRRVAVALDRWTVRTGRLSVVVWS